MKLENLPEMLKVGDIAKYLRVADLTVKRWIYADNLKAQKIGRAYYIKKQDFVEYIQENEV